MIKICTKCKIEKDFSEYNRSNRNRSGIRAECKTCQRAASKGQNQAHRAEYKRQHQKANKEKYAKISAAYRERNPDRAAMTYAKMKEYYRGYGRRWRKENPDKHNAKAAKYRCALLKAIPKWLTPQDFIAIDEFYSEAQRLTRETGIIHHVDHIIPLQGTNVCGLHVPSNLQVISATENLKKNNKFEGI